MEQEILQCIARNLKYLRLCCGYSQDDLAKYLHLSRTSYGAVEKGNQNASDRPYCGFSQIVPHPARRTV